MDNQEREFVTVKDINGCFLKTYKSSHHAKCVVKHGTYEPALYYFLKDYLSKIDDPAYLDVGAHVGIHTVTMSKLSKQVLAFEPAKKTFDLLQNNINQNKLCNVKVFNEALSDKTGSKELFHISKTNPGQNSLSTLKASPSCEIVSIARGDDTLQQENIDKVDFIKIDVEGHEGEVLHGLENTIKTHRPVLALEWNNLNTRQYFFAKELFQHLLKGYSCFSLGARGERIKKRIFENIKPRAFAKLCNSIASRVISGQGYELGNFDSSLDYALVLLRPSTMTI